MKIIDPIPHWEPGVLCKCKDGSFFLTTSLEAVSEETKATLTGEYNKIHWRMGPNKKPIVRLQDGSELEIK